ncbi:putative eka-like protein [Erysiphe necator]|uniref:Putative eka-like protein n=1 Tax=Uncinula necator TaxID=52586 RepID=A0A0B1NYJ7_UNCNE|nr:putative eka-like protein [Erysiphe necator]
MEQGLVEVSKVMLADEIGRKLLTELGWLSLQKQQPLEFCKRCNGHHPSKNCSRAPSCANCGSTNHVADSCMAATKCRNCGGPHRANSLRCQVRPTRSGAPSKEQMKAYGQMGEREYKAVQRARIAVEKAAVVDRIETDPLSSLAPEESLICKNFQATPVEDSTAVASRL